MPLPRSPLLSAFVRLWRHAALRVFLGKRGVALLLFAALPSVLAWIQVSNDPRVSMDEFLAVILMFVFGFVVPLLGLFLGVSVLGDEIEGRTITYLFTRPHPRAIVLLARYLGVASAFALVIFGATAFTAKLYASRVALTGTEIAGTAAVAALGFAVYAALFTALRLFFRRALFIGFIVGIIFEGGVSKLPESGIARCTVWHHLALLETRLFDRKLLASGDLREVLSGIARDETAVGSLAVLLGVLLVSLGAGWWRIRSREVLLANAST